MKSKTHRPESVETFRYVQIRHLQEQLQKILADLEWLSENKKPDIERGINLQSEVQNFEIEIIQWALGLTAGHQLRAASLLQMKPTTLHNKIKVYRIPCQRMGEPTRRKRA